VGGRRHHRKDPRPAARPGAQEGGPATPTSACAGKASNLHHNPELVARSSGDTFALARSRSECHYFVNGAFLDHGGQLLTDVGRIRHVPTVIVQGRYDVVCPMASAWALHRAFPEADLRIVADAGHSASEPGIVHELVEATDRFRRT
jgi:proline iminopeptidase